MKALMNAHGVAHCRRALLNRGRAASRVASVGDVRILTPVDVEAIALFSTRWPDFFEIFTRYLLR
ncbi:hypothetical protein [Paraburkholderia sp. BR14374]|uniref:hypothetical protein n=1 Tax=Paraburkholderia sp. BR14374 TaxID=3237007 RepID=UPI0034CD47C6